MHENFKSTHLVGRGDDGELFRIRVTALVERGGWTATEIANSGYQGAVLALCDPCGLERRPA